MSSAHSSSATASVQTQQRTQRWALYALAGLGGAALLLTGLLVTRRTSLAPDIYVLSFACWLIGSLLSVIWERRRGATPTSLLNPLMLFFAIVAATFTVHAIDAVPAKPLAFNTNQPDDLPGLYTNFTPYYLVLLAATALFVSWYGRRRERETEAGIAVLVVYTSLAFEHMLRAAGNEQQPAVGSLAAPLLWAPLLVLFVMWRSDAVLFRRAWRWTPLGGPIIALLAAGVISTFASVYAHASLLMLLRIAAFSGLLLLVANTIQSVRQLHLYWLALVGPLAGAALAIVIKLWQINAHLGPGFVLSLRYQISGVAGTNPAGLSLGIGILLVLGALIVERDRRWRWSAILLVPFGVAFLSTHSPSGLVALVAALAGLAVIRFGSGIVRGGPRTLAWAAGAAAAAALLLALVALVPNPYTGKVSGDVTDPTTGRSVRGLVWRLAFESFRENPIAGVGLQNYYDRTQHVGDFPSPEATRVGERRLLLGGTNEPWKPYITSHPHNAYLAVLETMGLPGLVALLWLATALTAIGWRLFRRADGSFAWWTAVVPLAGAGMALAWNIVAQGEDITVIALPFWPLMGMALGALALLEPERASGGSNAWARIAAPVERWWSGPMRGPALAALTALVFLAIVARPVAAEVLVQKSDESADVDNARSLQMMRWAERLAPMSADYRKRLSDAYLRAGSLQSAIREQRKVLDSRRDFAPDHVRLGWLYWLRDNRRDALAEFERAAELDRWDTTRQNVHMVLGLAQASNGSYEQALDTFAYGFSVSPSTLDDEAWLVDDSSSPPLTYLDPSYLLPAGQAFPLDLQRNILRRLDQPARRSKVRPPDTTNDYSLSAVLDRMHSDAESLLEAKPARADSLLSTIGGLALKAGLSEQAVAYYQELAARRPDDEAVQYGLGLAYQAAGDTGQAEASFRRVLALSDEESGYVLREPFSHFELGLLALQAQPPDLNTARHELDDARATYRWSYLPKLYRYLALADALSGDLHAARQAIDKELYLLGVTRGSAGGGTSAEPTQETAEPLER